ncbi:MAG: hypothetical protein FDW93_02640 [Bergeyella sp.]|nr:hypothetical protein [Bergeyella sp.]
MKKLSLLSTIIGTCLLTQAQTIGNSPYAVYGIGDEKYDNTIDIGAMGGISTAYVNDLNNKFNFANSAANQNFGLTSFSIEGTNENNFLRTNYQNNSLAKKSVYLSNVSLAFPLSKSMKFGVRFQPYSSKMYTIVTKDQIDENTTSINRFMGKGSISIVQGALSFKINEDISLGLRSNTYFGRISDTEELSYSSADLVNGYENSTKILAYNFTAGGIYQRKLSKDKKLTLGGTYTFGNLGTVTTQYTNSTYYYIGDGTKKSQTILDSKEYGGKGYFPMEASVGVGYGKDLHWFLSTQFDYKKGETIWFLSKPFQYQDAYKFSFGGWILPSVNNFRNYFSRVVYRYGVYYQKGSLRIIPKGSTSPSLVNEFAITGGASLPFANANINKLSYLDLGIEIGQRGSLQNNLVRQTFVNLKVGINFADLWFRKVQYD